MPVASLSVFTDPVYLGIDENGEPVTLDLLYRNILIGGEPGSGKSAALNTIVAHAALCPDTSLWLFDGKLVELGLWADVADVFVGKDITSANTKLEALQAEMDTRYDLLATRRLRKIRPEHGLPVIFCVIDKIAYYSATVGGKDQRERFTTLLRDLVARGRAAGIIVVAATQRPSADIIPTSLRDLFGYRLAGRCTTDISSDIILGYGWAAQGFTARDIAPDEASRGVGWLIAETGLPRRVKTCYLSDAQIDDLVDHATWIRRPIRNNVTITAGLSDVDGQPGWAVAV